MISKQSSLLNTPTRQNPLVDVLNLGNLAFKFSVKSSVIGCTIEFRPAFKQKGRLMSAQHYCIFEDFCEIYFWFKIFLLNLENAGTSGSYVLYNHSNLIVCTIITYLTQVKHNSEK